MRSLLAILAVAVVGCKTPPTSLPNTETQAPGQCGLNKPQDGALLPVGDGVSIWYKIAGNASGPVVVFLHGGPGYNAYAFEHAVGALLEPHVRMVYFDQRGCGRSWFPATPDQLGIKNTIEDLEKLRAHTGAQRIFLVGHSFGGLVALEYQQAYPQRVAGLMLVEISANTADALDHQVETLASIAPDKFPDKIQPLRDVAESKQVPFKKLMAAYELLGKLPLQRQLHFASDDGQARNERWDEESGLMKCDSGPVAATYFSDGYIDSTHPELMKPLSCRAVVFAGRKSNVIGAAGISAAARAWGADVRWFERSGHFVYVEEPKLFARAVEEFVNNGL